MTQGSGAGAGRPSTTNTPLLGGYLDPIPITAAVPEVPAVTPDAVPSGHWVRHWHYPRPVSPLYADFEFGSHLFLSERVAAREYAAISAHQPDRHQRGGRFLLVDGHIYKEQTGHLKPGTPEGDASAVVMADPPADLPASYEWVVLRRWPSETRLAVIGNLDRFRSTPLDTISDGALLAHIRALSDHLTIEWALYFTVDAAARLVRVRCQKFCREHLDLDESSFLDLLTGFSPATSAPVTRLEDLAAEVLRAPHLHSALGAPDPWTVPAIRTLLQPYLDEYGHRATDWEYVSATLAERPARAVRLLQEAVARRARGAPRTGEVARQQRDARIAALRADLPDETMRATFDRLLADAQETHQIHEDNINLYNLGSGYMRYALLEAGARLAARGALPDRERVFFLRRGELEAALAGLPSTDLRSRSEARWTDYQRQRLTGAPRDLGSPQATAAPAHPRATHAPGRDTASVPRSATPAAPPRLRGLGASPGTYTGTARVIVGEDQFEQVQPGDVLVCPQTSPTWTLLFGRIGALVTDDGGILSHSAIASREFGIPAVLATRSATRTIVTGQRVQVDGKAGTVEIVDSGASAASADLPGSGVS